MEYEIRVKPILYDEISGVPSSTLSTVLEKNFNANEKIWVTNIICSGEIFSEFSLHINEEKVATERSSPTRNVNFTFPKNLYFEDGNKLQIKVIHYRSDQTPKFECGVFGFN